MCGIAGIVYRDQNREPERQLLDAMGEAIAHRGPDGAGVLCSGGVGLIHRRLSIIDLEGGAQPLSNEDGRFTVVFNGEIYNHAQIRASLEAAGHTFRTRSDTEVLVHLAERGSPAELFGPLRGMFAFAMWDARERQLWLGRDRLGIKPLYIHEGPECVVFGSELKAVLACPEVSRTLDRDALDEYLAFGFVPGPRSIFRTIRKLPPGHFQLIGPKDWPGRPQQYWQPAYAPDASRTEAEWIEAVRASVDDAVASHLVSDVPVGTFLSGGIDSSVVTALASRQSALHTFTVGFDEADFSELETARATAAQLGTTHHEEIVTPRAVELIDQLVTHFDEPFADPSAVPTYLISKVAARHVKVVLSGDGGDEGFGGYRRYAVDAQQDRARRLLPTRVRRGMARLSDSMEGSPLRQVRRAAAVVGNLSMEAEDAYVNSVSIMPRLLRRRLSGRTVDAAGSTIVAAHRQGAPDIVTQMMAADVAVRLPDGYLVKVDRASMAHGLEVRPPLLDHHLFSLAASVPAHLKIAGMKTKVLLRRAFEADLPPRLSTLPKKGFGVPVDLWFQKDLRPMFGDLVLSSSSALGSLVSIDTAEQLLAQHVRGEAAHGRALWALLTLEVWMRRYRPSLS